MNYLNITTSTTIKDGLGFITFKVNGQIVKKVGWAIGGYWNQETIYSEHIDSVIEFAKAQQ